jgi:hypothetical protein
VDAFVYRQQSTDDEGGGGEVALKHGSQSPFPEDEQQLGRGHANVLLLRL